MPAVNTCQPGAIELAPLAGQVTNQDFAAVLVGDCTGNWQRATPTATPARSPVGARSRPPIGA